MATHEAILLSTELQNIPFDEDCRLTCSIEPVTRMVKLHIPSQMQPNLHIADKTYFCSLGPIDERYKQFFWQMNSVLPASIAEFPKEDGFFSGSKSKLFHLGLITH
jgi:hypothetical protein